MGWQGGRVRGDKKKKKSASIRIKSRTEVYRQIAHKKREHSNERVSSHRRIVESKATRGMCSVKQRHAIPERRRSFPTSSNRASTAMKYDKRRKASTGGEKRRRKTRNLPLRIHHRRQVRHPRPHLILHVPFPTYRARFLCLACCTFGWSGVEDAESGVLRVRRMG